MAKDRRQLSEKVVARLSLYRRLLTEHFDATRPHVYSHELARLACVSSAQVRRDVMLIACSGTPNRGYAVPELIADLGRILDNPTGERVALVGAGHLGRALISFFNGRRPHLRIVVAFDTDPEKVDQVVDGCPCYPLARLAEVIGLELIRTAILTVPPQEGQRVVDLLVDAGVTGILNCTAVPLRVPPGIFVVERDMTMALETVAFLARGGAPPPRPASR